MFQTEVVQNIKTHILYSIPFFPFWDKIEEYRRNRLQHTNNMPPSRLPRIIKHYRPKYRRNKGIWLKRLLDSWRIKFQLDVTCHFILLLMFRTLIYPSSEACDYSVELPQWSYCSWFDVCWSFGVVGLEWYPCCRMKLCFSLQQGLELKHSFSLQHGYHSNPTTTKLQHTSNQEQYDQCGNSTE